MSAGHCEGCGEFNVLLPLHGGKGGPLRCPLCVGKWNAEHGRKRRLGRIVIRAIKAFEEAGGSPRDIGKLKDSALFLDIGFDYGEITDPLGYMADIAKFDDADIDLTCELLADVLKLTHPDHQPPERQELAHRVTQRLLALQPFVFPAPIPEKPLLDNVRAETSKELEEPKPKQPRYPCSDCASAFPSDYCDACRAEYEKREQKEFERRTAKQRAKYKQSRGRLLAKRAVRRCEDCGAEFKRTRTDARYCSDTCRQRAHRQAAVTDKHPTRGVRITNRDKLERGILALLARRPAVFLNDILPEGRTRAQYQQLLLATGRLEAAGKVQSWSYWSRWNKPGNIVLLRPGHKLKHGSDVPPLKAREKLKLPRRASHELE